MKSRWQSRNRIDVRTRELIEILASRKRLAFEELPLSFGKQRVKRQRAFSAAATTGDHNQRVARNINVDVFEIVRASAGNSNDVVLGFRGLLL